MSADTKRILQDIEVDREKTRLRAKEAANAFLRLRSNSTRVLKLKNTSKDEQTIDETTAETNKRLKRPSRSGEKERAKEEANKSSSQGGYTTMAMNPTQAAEGVATVASDPIRNKTLVAPSSMQNRFSKALNQLVAAFLTNSELAQYSRVALFSRDASKIEWKERKIMNELLFHVFDASTRGVRAFFTKYPETKPNRLLTETSFQEGYHSEKVSEAERSNGKFTKFVPFRRWNLVSPIKAAAFTLNNFLLLKLLAHIIHDEVETGDEKPRLKARKQLKEVRSRIVAKEKSVDATEVAVGSHTAPCALTPTHNCEKKSSTEDIQNYADFAEYAAPVKAYLDACSDYIAQEPTLYAQRDVAELNRLWDKKGDCWKKLFTYVKREFFKKMRWSDDPDFLIEPPDGVLRFWENGPLLKLDGLGGGTFNSIIKGVAVMPPAWGRGARSIIRFDDDVQTAQIDSAAIGRLCELRPEGLNNIIDKLRTLETALTLVAVEKSPILPRCFSNKNG